MRYLRWSILFTTRATEPTVSVRAVCGSSEFDTAVDWTGDPPMSWYAWYAWGGAAASGTQQPAC